MRRWFLGLCGKVQGAICIACLVLLIKHFCTLCPGERGFSYGPSLSLSWRGE